MISVCVFVCMIVCVCVCVCARARLCVRDIDRECVRERECVRVHDLMRSWYIASWWSRVISVCVFVCMIVCE
jgi:hypothetical protein